MIDLSTLTMKDIVRLQNLLQKELARRFERRLLMLFSDIVGSTPYFARFGDAAGHQLQQVHQDLLERSFAPVQGRIVDVAGDGAFCVFPSAEAGVQGVMAFANAAAAENSTRDRPHQLTVRIGMHWGTALTDGETVSGDAVNIASRVVTACEPGTVLLTRQVFLELGPVRRLHCHALGPRELKGVAEPLHLLELDWRDALTFPRRMVVEETGEAIELPQRDIVTFGRLQELDGWPANDIVLAHPNPALSRAISRWHFELRRVPEGLRLRALSDSTTAIDGVPVAKGVEVPVKSGSAIRVGDVLTLRLASPLRPPGLDDESKTMMPMPLR